MRVGVLGASGKMGRLVCAAVDAERDLELVAAVNPSLAGQPLAPLVGMSHGELRISGSADALLEAEAEVAVDFTTPDAVMANVRYCVDHGINTVVGTTGIGPDEQDQIRKWVGEEREVGVIVAPNFSVGAVLAQRLAEDAARFFHAAEIVELHHEQKADAPSGTAAATARRIASAREEAWKGPTGGEEFRGGDVEGIRIHSVRLPGLVAHQEVIFGAQGQILTIRHDASDRSCYLPGVLLAIRSVDDRPGLTVGLEPLLGL
ncbi:MAG TPA: 4-hydroxy-tetrahydrodipicolinate reductase [Actinomycetota bacterium]|nr:4-hydroxy-tetrahydrodipicolinate reductase [Actinomycetota bacterium]